MTATMELRRHGTAYGYDAKGCRCDECRAAKTAARRKVRHRARATMSASYLRELAAGRERKERYRGTCEVCGSPTTGGNGRVAAPKRCIHHNTGGLKQRGRGPTVEKILAFVGDGERRYTEIVDGCGITPGLASNRLNRLVAYGLLERVSRGVYRRSAP